MIKSYQPLAIFLLLLSARAQEGPLARKPNTPLPPPDFDIRDHVGHDSSVTEQRQAAAEAVLASPPFEHLRDARLIRNRRGLPAAFFHERAPLTAPSPLPPEDIARQFVRTYRGIFPFTTREVEALRLLRSYSSNGIVLLHFNQTLDGIPVFQGQVKIALNPAGQVVHAGVGDVVPGLDLRTEPRLDARGAVAAAFLSLGIDPPAGLEPRPPVPGGNAAFRNPRGEPYSDITAELYIFPMASDSARLAYRVFVEIDKARWFEILVDAEDGLLLFRHNLYRFAGQGRVWRESPQVGEREVVAFPEGWLPATATVTTGNNVDAYLDTDGDNVPDTAKVPDTQNGRAFSPGQNFDFPAGEGSTGQDPRGFKAAAVTNLFYLVNTAHDYFYELGFTEAAGNFQNDNFGRGGEDGDAVRAEAQDRAMASNASFAVTPDGFRPRMQIGIFTRNTPETTDDLDADYSGPTVIHEYTHGVTTRLVGGPADVSCLSRMQSRALGEGWSDYFAISFFNNPVLGSYLGQDSSKGDRRQSYEGYTFTYEDLGNQGYEVHRDGEIWAAALWDLRKSLGQAATDRLVLDGLRFTPCNPVMTDARDGILFADQAMNGGANRSRIWQVFARHGLGFSASGTDGTLFSGVVHNAAFDLPPELQPGNRSPIVISQPARAPGLGDRYSYTVAAFDPEGGPLRYELSDGPSGMTIDASTGLLRWTVSAVSGPRVKVTITDGQGGKVVHGFLLPIDTLLLPDTPITLEAAQGTIVFAHFTAPAGAPVLQVTLRGGSGDPDMVLFDPNGFLAGESYRGGTTETASIPVPWPGRWTVFLLGYRRYSGVAVSISFPVPPLLPGSAMRSDLSGEVSSETFFRISVPPGASFLRISTSGGAGDVDLFLQRDWAPDCQVVRNNQTPTRPWFIGDGCDWGSAKFDTNEEDLVVNDPPPGNWYINLSASETYSGVRLNTELNVLPTLVVSQSDLVFSAAQGGAAPPTQTLMIFDPSGSAFGWTAQAATISGGKWLALSQTSGTGAASVPVSVQPAGLAAGTYHGAIVVTAPGMNHGLQIVGVTLTVSVRAP